MIIILSKHNNAPEMRIRFDNALDMNGKEKQRLDIIHNELSRNINAGFYK